MFRYHVYVNISRNGMDQCIFMYHKSIPVSLIFITINSLWTVLNKVHFNLTKSNLKLFQNQISSITLSMQWHEMNRFRTINHLLTFFGHGIHNAIRRYNHYQVQKSRTLRSMRLVYF